MNSFSKAQSVHSIGDVSDFTRFSTESKVHSSPATQALIQRLQDLKSLQAKTTELKRELRSGINELIRSFGQRLNEVNDRRRSIIKGEKEREGDEVIQDDETTTNLAREIADRHMKHDKSGKIHLAVKGVPNFWETVFKNSWTLGDIVQPDDVPILSKLDDVRVKYTLKEFCLEFHFQENDYFRNRVLTKQYVVDDNPTSLKTDFDIVKSIGCQIFWFPGKNVTIKLGKKRQKHKISGALRYVDVAVKKASFFNFFDPPVQDDSKVVTRELRTRLAMDFELGQYFRTKIVPDAYLFFAGMMDDQDDKDFEDDNSIDSSSDLDSMNSKRK
uniref:Nucleosome assembly protein 1-like 4 n=1 Tax=Lygus hesperus TaxID=30085 RepID=A0A0A9ZJ08_LYGHE